MSKISFTPKSDEQFKAEEAERAEQFLWPVGEYPYEITGARGKTSAEKFDANGDYKSGGKPMVELKVTLFNGDKTQFVYDYLLTEGGFAFKLRHAAYASGLGKDYEAGTLDPADFENKTGIAKVGLQKAKDGYPAKNIITDYVLDSASSVEYSATKTAKAQASAPELDDDLPF